MSATIAVLLKKLALMAATDKRFWTGIFSVIVGLIVVIVLFFGVLFSIFSGGTQANNDMMKYIFYPELPITGFEEGGYHYNHIVACRMELAELKSAFEAVTQDPEQEETDDEETETGFNILKAQVIFYVLFLDSGGAFDKPSKDDFAACFYEETGDEIIIIEDEEIIFQNIEALIGREITEEEREQIDAIYNLLTGGTTMLIVSGEYGPPVEPQYMSSITSHFGTRIDPISKKTGAFHNGTDFAWSDCYGARIYAVADGTVTRASDVSDGFGICVVIDHGSGVQTYYAHCSGAAVSVGQQVVKGQHIAYIGSTGRSTGNHLHLGLKVNGNWQDPLSLYR